MNKYRRKFRHPDDVDCPKCGKTEHNMFDLVEHMARQHPGLVRTHTVYSLDEETAKMKDYSCICGDYRGALPWIAEHFWKQPDLATHFAAAILAGSTFPVRLEDDD